MTQAMTNDELIAEWKRLEDAFHDSLPDQGDPGDPAAGKALCQFLYDNSPHIRAALQSRADDVERPVIAEIAAERRRQIGAEGWTPEHDEHDDGALAKAAACYAGDSRKFNAAAPPDWPWSQAWWKPSDRRRNLIKAGALIVAEIERIDRAALGATDA
jgi:hypothetical protein